LEGVFGYSVALPRQRKAEEIGDGSHVAAIAARQRLLDAAFRHGGLHRHGAI